ncbi:TetR/AcrR family transcriptional regulator [Brachybacterium hainanense]|uniref:TetR/AcrR family transcriptional regulator n=1 Tax=Brachybacterium hainanense TaxID=1541174 RepID=A0ABV6REI9_9MICO
MSPRTLAHRRPAVHPERKYLTADGSPATPDVPEDAEDTSPSRMFALARREQILDAAAAAFAEHGYHGVSVRTLASTIGISHPGLLHHFPTKTSILSAVIDRLEDRAQSALDEDLDAMPGRDETIRGIVDFYDPGSHLIQLLATLDSEGVSSEYPERMRSARLRRVHEHIIERRLAQLAEDGGVRPRHSPAFAARAFLSLVMGYATRERTVRTMQDDVHGDAPRAELRRALELFLRE